MGLTISPIVLPPGLPNAGKSSVLNAVLGRSAVSVSRTPGRTRYFQTHFLTPTVRLCDCPGLVFPSTAPRELQVGPQPPNSPLVSTNTAFIASFPPHPPPPQVLAGVYPISQLQEPYSAVGFLATRLPLPTLLALRPPSSPAGWTAWDICEGKSASFRVPITPNRGFFCLLYPSRPLHPPLYPFFGGSVGREARLSHGQGGAARRVPGGQQHPAHGGRRASAALPAAPRIQRQRQ